jgi:hypothetical protein
MAYLEFAEGLGGAVLDRPFAAASTATHPADFTPLEWSVVAIAQRDKLSSVERPGLFSSFWHWAFGGSVATALSDARLEALRRIAVLSWYRGFSIAPAEVRAFLAAGFTPEQYETLLARVSAGRAALPRRFAR